MKDYKEHQKRRAIAEKIVRHTQHNRAAVGEPGNGRYYGCICCGKIFPRDRIKNLEGDTAVCPFCGMKTILAVGGEIQVDPESLCQYGRIIQEDIVEKDSVSESLFPSSVLRWILSRQKNIHKSGKAEKGAA